MDYEVHAEARRIAARLLADCRAGRLLKIGIGEVRDAIRRAGYEYGSPTENEQFEHAVVRAIVEAAG